MIGTLKSCIKDEEGAVAIVEATIVFPIMFIILFFLVFMGNAYYVKAQVESVVEKNAIYGANLCSDPVLEKVKEKNHIPSLSNIDIKPYRYIFGGMSEVEKKIRENVTNELTGNTSTFFKGMQPQLIGSSKKIALFNNYVVYSTFSVEVKYRISFPIRFLGDRTPTVMELTSRAEIPVNDAPEFIRNTDMVIDLMHDTKVGKKISDLFAKINDFLSKFAKN